MIDITCLGIAAMFITISFLNENTMNKRIKQLETALRDAISTYKGADKIVNAERIEAWESALVGDRACRSKNGDVICDGCDCWKATRARCS